MRTWGRGLISWVRRGAVARQELGRVLVRVRLVRRKPRLKRGYAVTYVVDVTLGSWRTVHFRSCHVPAHEILGIHLPEFSLAKLGAV